MGFESFYGGRMGASFIIVKHFDGIDIPAGSQYRKKVCAIYNYNGVDLYYYPWIERNKNNYSLYTWKILPLDGSTVDVWDSASSVVSQQVTDIVEAEGMRQCFEQGGDTTDIVNYGEYVIIDTIAGLGEFSNPDNGKVYRRGMNFDYSSTTNPLAGAEYIGQIVGPQGETPEVVIDHYNDIVEEHGSSAHARIYDVVPDEDIVPGSWEESGSRHFKDDIDYVFATLKDEFGNITGCTIGFKITTLVDDFEAQSMSPYEQRAVDPETGKYYNYGLISEDPNQYIDGKWLHPFYQKWQIKVPHGYHGINSTNLEIIPTYTMPKGFKSNNFEGAPVYIDAECNEPLIEEGSIVVLENATEILRDADYDADPAIISAKVNYNGTICYVKKEDCYMDIMRYRETNFDNLETGEVTYYEIGDYNTIQRITLSDDGTLTVFYSAGRNPRELEEILRWIDTKNSDGITIDEDGTVHVYYNTVHDPLGPSDPYEKLDDQGRAHDHQDYMNVLDWITEVTLTQEGKFTVLFNNDTIQDGRYETTLQWIDWIDVSEDGIISFYYNTDHNYPAYQAFDRIKYISNLTIQTKNSPTAYEGTGDQKVHVEYNTGESEIIGEALNYIIETKISIPNSDFPTVPYCHLLVYYADPALRLALKNVYGWVTYPSDKVIDGTDPVTGDPIYHVWTEWIDLGPCRGVPGGIHILKDVDDLADLKDSSGNPIPPEQLPDSSGTIINPDAAGWAVTYTPVVGNPSEIMFYDYEVEEWYSIGSIDSSAVDPKYVIDKSDHDANNQPVPGTATQLKANGFWFATEQMKYAL